MTTSQKKNLDAYSRRLSTVQAFNCWRSYRNLMNLQLDNNVTVAEDAKVAFRALKNEKLARTLSLSIFCAPPVTDLQFFCLGIFANLQELHLDSCPLSTIEDLFILRDRLRFLYVTNSGIPDLQSVLVPINPKYFRKLSPMILAPTKASFSGRMLPEFQWTKLETFRTINCGVCCIDQTPHFMPQLASLDMSYNDIAHVVHLQDCSQLSVINMSHNRIRVLSNLERVLGNIIKLDLSHNFIESLDGLDKLHSLQRVDLSFNLIDDVQEVAVLSSLPNLEAIVLEGNSIATPMNYRINVFRVLLNSGSDQPTASLTSDVHHAGMNGADSSNLPALDGSNMSDHEAYVLRGQMFKTTENDEKGMSKMLHIRHRDIDDDEGLARHRGRGSGGDGDSDDDGCGDTVNSDLFDAIHGIPYDPHSPPAMRYKQLPLNSVSRDTQILQRMKSTVAQSTGGVGSSAAMLLAGQSEAQQQMRANMHLNLSLGQGRGTNVTSSASVSSVGSSSPVRPTTLSGIVGGAGSSTSKNNRLFVRVDTMTSHMTSPSPPFSPVRRLTDAPSLSSSRSGSGSGSVVGYATAGSRLGSRGDSPIPGGINSKYRPLVVLSALLNRRAKARSQAQANSLTVSGIATGAIQQTDSNSATAVVVGAGSSGTHSNSKGNFVSVWENEHRANTVMPDLDQIRNTIRQMRFLERNPPPAPEPAMVTKFAYTTSKTSALPRKGKKKRKSKQTNASSNDIAQVNGNTSLADVKPLRSLQEEIDASSDEDEDEDRYSLLMSDSSSECMEENSRSDNEEGDDDSLSFASRTSKASTAIFGEPLVQYSALTEMDYSVIKHAALSGIESEGEGEGDSSHDHDHDGDGKDSDNNDSTGINNSLSLSDSNGTFSYSSDAATPVDSALVSRVETPNLAESPTDTPTTSRGTTPVPHAYLSNLIANDGASADTVTDIAAATVTTTDFLETSTPVLLVAGEGEEKEDREDQVTGESVVEVAEKRFIESVEETKPPVVTQEPESSLHCAPVVVTEAVSLVEAVGSLALDSSAVVVDTAVPDAAAEEGSMRSTTGASASENSNDADAANTDSVHVNAFDANDQRGDQAPNPSDVVDDEALSELKALGTATVVPIDVGGSVDAESAENVGVGASSAQSTVESQQWTEAETGDTRGSVPDTETEVPTYPKGLSDATHVIEKVESKVKPESSELVTTTDDELELKPEESSVSVLQPESETRESVAEPQYSDGAEVEALKATMTVTEDAAESSVPETDDSVLPVETAVRLPVAGVYVGDPAYGHFTVADHLEMYFRQQVFSNYSQTTPYYLKHSDSGGNDSGSSGQGEVWVNKPIGRDGSESTLESLAFVFHEDMLEIEHARTQNPTVSVDSDAAVAPQGASPARFRNSSSAGFSQSVEHAHAMSLDRQKSMETAEESLNGSAAADEPKSYVFLVTDRTLYILSYDPRQTPLRSSAWGKILGSSTNKLHAVEQAALLTFSDAPVFTVHRSHPLRDFRQYTLFFSYQRCALEFVDTSGCNEASNRDGESSTSASATAVVSVNAPETSTYVVITRDKPRTIGFITKLYQLANSIRQQYHPSPGCPLRRGGLTGTTPAADTTAAAVDLPVCSCTARLPKVVIKNNEGALLDALHRWYTDVVHAQQADQQDDDSEVLYYQMLYQLFPTSTSVTISGELMISGRKASRSVVLTPAYILLCEEVLDSDSLDLKVLDHSSYADVCALKAEESPLCLTITVKQAQKTKKRMSVFGSAVPKRHWTLCATNRTIIEKATQEIRRLCKAKGNTDIK